jgi:hypothetical protein
LCQPSIGHRELRSLGARQVPRSTGATSRQHSVILGDAHLQKVADPRSGSAPLYPVAHSDPAANPLINLRKRPVVLADPKVPHSTPKVAAQFRQATTHRHAPIAFRQSPDFSPETRRGLLGPADLDSPKVKAKKRVRGHHLALLSVDLELEATAKKPGHARQDPLAGALASDQDDQVVGVTSKPETPTFELPIEIVEHDVGEQRRQGRSLRNPLPRGMELAVDQDAGPQVFADQPQQALVGHVAPETEHQDIEVDSIEELLQIEVDGDAMPGPDVTLDLLDRSMSGASRSIGRSSTPKSRGRESASAPAGWPAGSHGPGPWESAVAADRGRPAWESSAAEAARADSCH